MAKVSLEDRMVIITGAARGLGRAMTLGLVEAGARVAAMDLPSADAEMQTVVAAAKGGGERILPLHCDVTDAASAAAAVAAAQKHFGAVFGLVNNAGRGMQDFGPVMVGAKKKFYELDVAMWRGSIDTNVVGPFIMAKTVAPLLLAQGKGRIVNIVTSFFAMVMESFTPYGPSKAALEAATAAWAKELAGTGVTVNALLPGGAANTRLIPDGEVTDRSTLIQPDAMVAPIQWLMSSGADTITGRRFIANKWDGSLAPGEAAEKAGAPAAW